MPSIGISVNAMVVGIAYLAVDAWMRGFLALGLLYVVTWSTVCCGRQSNLGRTTAGSAADKHLPWSA